MVSHLQLRIRAKEYFQMIYRYQKLQISKAIQQFQTLFFIDVVLAIFIFSFKHFLNGVSAGLTGFGKTYFIPHIKFWVIVCKIKLRGHSYFVCEVSGWPIDSRIANQLLELCEKLL
jgi:hypothetical protein